MTAALTGGGRPEPVMGVFDRPYWRYVAAGELRLQRCDDCGAFRYPPGPVCAGCLSDACTWTALCGRGRIVAWTVFHRAYFPGLPVPYTVVSVATAEGPLLVGNLIGGTASLDLPVHAVFETVTTPNGDWRICQWTPERPAPERPTPERQ